MIITSDWHLKEESADVIFGEVIPGIVQACIENSDKEAVCLGDLLHFRYKVPARLLNQLRDILKQTYEEHQITWRILPGNHDQYEVGGRNALEVLDEIPTVSVFTDPEWDFDGLWIPYRKHKEDLIAALAMPDPPHLDRKVLDHPSIAFMHHGVAGAWMNDHIQNGEGLTDAAFVDFDHIFTGHYHKHHTVGRVTYIGSPYQTNAGESGQQKGYVSLRSDGQWQFVPTNWGKKFHRFEVDTAELNFEGIDPRDEVRVRTAAGVDTAKVAAQLIAAGIQNHVVTPDQEALQARLDVPENAGLANFAAAYVDAQETPLDKKHLMHTFQVLTQ